MTQQLINYGAAANDGTGDTLRTGAEKINANFTDLYSKQLPPTTGNAGRVLSNNGTDLVWTQVQGVGNPSASTLSGTILAPNVTTSSLTTVGTLTNLSVSNAINANLTGNAGTASRLQTARKINGVFFDGTADVTIPIYTIDASNLTGTSLPTAIVASSLTSVGTLTSLTTAGDVTVGGNLLVQGTTTTVNNETVNNTETVTGSLVVNGTLSGAGVSTYLASPPSIGTTAAGIIKGTEITATTGFVGNLTGTASNAAAVTNGVYTTDVGTVSNTMLAGSIANSKLAFSSFNINGVAISLGENKTIAAAASTLTGNTLASGIINSSLTTIGTLSSITVTGAIAFDTGTSNQSYTTTGIGTIAISAGSTGNINNMNIGGTTAAQGSFTTLSASSTVSGTGFSAYLASPPIIGGTAANAASFTTLSANNVINFSTAGHNQTFLTTGTATISIASGAAGTIDNMMIGNSARASGKFTSVDSNTSILCSGTGGIGYEAGAGGSVAQPTSRGSTVVLNKPTGQITLYSGTVPANTTQSFTLTNSCIGPNDIVYVQHISAGTLGLYNFTAAAGNGSATIYIRNNTGTTTPTEAPQIQFVVIKGAVA